MTTRCFGVNCSTCPSPGARGLGSDAMWLNTKCLVCSLRHIMKTQQPMDFHPHSRTYVYLHVFESDEMDRMQKKHNKSNFFVLLLVAVTDPESSTSCTPGSTQYRASTFLLNGCVCVERFAFSLVSNIHCQPNVVELVSGCGKSAIFSI